MKYCKLALREMIWKFKWRWSGLSSGASCKRKGEVVVAEGGGPADPRMPCQALQIFFQGNSEKHIKF